MDEITKFIAHMCHEPWPTVWEKPDSLIVPIRDQADMKIYKGTQYEDWADVKISKVAQ
jgi:hypothetical protein